MLVTALRLFGPSDAMEQLERTKRVSLLGYWIAVGVGFTLALAYITGMCAFGSLCN